MVKTTYALTLFAAVSLAAPVSNIEGNGNDLGSRATNEGSTEHKNLIEDLPIIGSILGNVRSNPNLHDDRMQLTRRFPQKHDSKRDVSEHQADHKNLIDGLPIIGELLGNVSSLSAHLPCMNQCTNEAREQQKGNQRRGLGGDGLSGIPLVGSLFGKVSTPPLLPRPAQELMLIEY